MTDIAGVYYYVAVHDNNVQWNLSLTTTKWDTYLPSGARLGGQGPPRWAP